MYIQIKQSHGFKYVYIAESFRKPDGSIGHRNLQSLGRLDALERQDPDFLAKLKLKLKQHADGMKVRSVLSAVEQLEHSDPHALINGFAELNFANALLGLIWKQVLKLDYRLNYLQKQYFPALEDKLSEALFRQVLNHLLDLKDDDRRWGLEFGLLGEDFDLNAEFTRYQQCLAILNQLEPKIFEFILQRLIQGFELKFLQFSPLEMPQQSGINLQALADGQLPADLSGQRLISTLSLILLRVLQLKLQQHEIKTDFKQIKAALGAAKVMVQPTPGKDDPFLYVKSGCGGRIRLMNAMLQSFGLLPVLNLQSGRELARRLKLRGSQDSKLIPAAMRNHSDLEV